MPNICKKRGDLNYQRMSTVYMFDPFIHMNLTDSAKINLECIEEYKEIEWFVESKKLMTGDSFGYEDLEKNQSRSTKA
jgi:hypothetical protein